MWPEHCILAEGSLVGVPKAFRTVLVTDDVRNRHQHPCPAVLLDSLDALSRV